MTPPTFPPILNAVAAIKIGSLIVHVQEYLGPHGHPFDREALLPLLDDPFVVAFLRSFPPGMLPEKRVKP